MTLWPFQSVVCFSTPYVRSFVAPRLSAAYLLYLLGVVAVVFFPLFAAFASDNVWVKESSYREQPMVTFARDLLLVLSAEKAVDAVGWSTRAELRPLLPPEVLVPVVRASSHDGNGDGLPDQLKLNVDMPILATAGRGYQHLFLLASYDYEIREKVAERIGGLVVVDVVAPYAASGVWLRGKLRLRQNLPFQVRKEPRTVYASNPLEVNFTSNWAAQHHPVTARALLDRYAAQNDTVYLDIVAPPVWSYSPADQFTAEIVLDIPPELIHYVPPALEVLKFAWVQFLAFLVPAWIVLRYVQAFAFENQIVETYVVPQMPPKGAI